MLAKRTISAALIAYFVFSPVQAQEGKAVEPKSNLQSNKIATVPVANTSLKKNLNQASEKELMEIPGMSLSNAKAIIAYRKSNGSFVAIEDLSKVKGFKRMKAEKLTSIQSRLTL